MRLNSEFPTRDFAILWLINTCRIGQTRQLKRTHGPLPSEIRIRRRGEGASAVAILSIINRAATRPHTENLVGNC